MARHHHHYDAFAFNHEHVDYDAGPWDNHIAADEYDDDPPAAVLHHDHAGIHVDHDQPCADDDCPHRFHDDDPPATIFDYTPDYDDREPIDNFTHVLYDDA